MSLFTSRADSWGQCCLTTSCCPPTTSAARRRTGRYPVLYLLHGLGGSAADWVSTRAHLADYAAQYPFIIVRALGQGRLVHGRPLRAGRRSSNRRRRRVDTGRVTGASARSRRAKAAASRASRWAATGLYEVRAQAPGSFSPSPPPSAWRSPSPRGRQDQRLPEFVRPSVMRVYGDCRKRRRVLSQTTFTSSCASLASGARPRRSRSSTSTAARKTSSSTTAETSPRC